MKLSIKYAKIKKECNVMEFIKSLCDAILNIFKSILGEDNEIFNSLKEFFEGLLSKEGE